ncbi:MAG: type II toxin-antitoxin system HicA family toxin [Acidobacteriota bacterium]|nr:type II toxin-antitoxin system HicA family toxin [Acidobacteriota bacterium]
MKRSALIRELLAAGCVLHPHGAKHDIYLNPANGTVPRHTEIDEHLAKHIKRYLGLQ